MQLGPEQDPVYKSSIVVFLIFLLIFAGYIILGNHATAFGQTPDWHSVVPTLEGEDLHDLEMEDLHDRRDNHDPLDGAVGDSELFDPREGRVFEVIAPNPYLQEGFTEEEWRKHYEYEYFLWLMYKPRSDIELEMLQKEKDNVQAMMRESVMRHLYHCIRRKDRTGALAKHCANAPGGCQMQIDLLTTYIVDVAYDLQLDPWLLAAIALHESTFNPRALGYARNERGYFQINPYTPLGRRTKFVSNARYRKHCFSVRGQCQREVAQAAAIHLIRDFKRCDGNLAKSLTAYNTGGCTVKGTGKPRYTYVNKVLRNRKSLLAGKKAVPWCDGRGGRAVPIFPTMYFDS